MGIRFTCPNGHKLHVKEHLAGKRGVCPSCGAKVQIPSAEEFPVASVVPTNIVTGATHDTPVAASSGPPSIVIPITDPPDASAAAATEPVVNRAAPPPPPVEPAPQIQALSSIAVTPPSPAAKYEAHRARARRNRTTIAIVLLIAVIVLAAVLVWVLQSGPTSSQSNATLGNGRLLACIADCMEHDPKCGAPAAGYQHQLSAERSC